MNAPDHSITSAEVAESPDVTVTDEASVKRAVKATMLGNAIEWFDFGVYAYLATTIGKVFFRGRKTLGLVADWIVWISMR